MTTGGLDIRLPIGMLFAVLGALLVAYGLVSGRAIYDQHSLGINVNLWWGLVLLAFGGAMIFFGRRGSAKAVSSKSAELPGE